MTRQGPGWCPFAEQVEGVTTFEIGGNERVGFCDHTAEGFYSTLKSAAFWNTQGVSTHFGVARDGRICQMVNIFDTAWAQGRLGPNPSWPKFAEMGRKNPNLYLISTEHEDHIMAMGHAQGVVGSQWTEAQFAADLKLKQWCVEEVAVQTNTNLMRFGLDSLTGHHMFDSVNRAECPGRFWRNEYRQRLYGALTYKGGIPMETDVKNGWIKEGTFQCFYNNGFCGERRGSTDGQFPFRISKAFGDPAKDGAWWWLRKAPQVDRDHNMASAYWTLEEGD